MTHFNNILHYVVDIFKDLRDDRHCLTGPIKLSRFTKHGHQYLFVSCKINILTAEDCQSLYNQMTHWHITGDNLEHIIDVEKARSYNVGKMRTSPYPAHKEV